MPWRLFNFLCISVWGVIFWPPMDSPHIGPGRQIFDGQDAEVTLLWLTCVTRVDSYIFMLLLLQTQTILQLEQLERLHSEIPPY